MPLPLFVHLCTCIRLFVCCRLSDYLFTLARYAAHKEGKQEHIYTKPSKPSWQRSTTLICTCLTFIYGCLRYLLFFYGLWQAKCCAWSQIHVVCIQILCNNRDLNNGRQFIKGFTVLYLATSRSKINHWLRYVYLCMYLRNLMLKTCQHLSKFSVNFDFYMARSAVE